MTRLLPAILAYVKKLILLNVIFGGLLYPPTLKTMFGLVMFAAVLKLPDTKALAFFTHYPLSSRPWSSISMDFVTDFPSSNNFTCILVVVDRLSKMCHLIPFQSIPSAEDTASAFINSIFRLHGLPEEIISDQGSQFTSKFWSSLCNAFNIKLNLSSTFHHQFNGQMERVNSVIEQYLRCFSNYKGTD